MRIYVAGAMTGKERYNYDAFMSAKARLESAGWVAVTPFECNSAVWERRHGVPFRPGVDKCDYGDPLLREMFAEDLKALLSCDAIALLPGWEESRGARVEKQVADLFGLEVFFLHD